MNRYDVEFPGAHGTILRGWLYLPEKPAGRKPAIVMAHGFTATKEMSLDNFAERFCQDGLVILLYDHRNFGASGGEPRQMINTWAQARDMRYAFNWLANRSEVDAKRIAVFGSSLSSDEAILVGAVDTRVRAVIANVTSFNTDATRPDAEQYFNKIRHDFLDESGQGPADSQTIPQGPVAVVSEPGNQLPVFFRGQNGEGRDWFLRIGRKPGTGWENRVLLQYVCRLDPNYDSGVCLEHIPPRPVLLVIATGDGNVENARAISKRHPGSIEIEVIEGHHFITYEGAGFEHASKVMRDFLRRHLQ
jgi:hypothetical protein